MSKGSETRQMIVRRAAEVFNRQGYSGASLADIMAATGLEKGGIYNHFSSKDDLALQAFDYAAGSMRRAFGRAIAGKRNAIERLHAIISVFRAVPEGFPVPGGCYLLNTAVEADYAHPLLRDRARQTVDEWRAFLRRIVARGIERGEVRPDIDPEVVATVIIATLEGGVMLSTLWADPVYMSHAIDHLTEYLETRLRL